MSDELKERTKGFAVRIITLFAALPKTTEAQVIGKQILRSGTSVGAQYREAQHAKSDADFISKVEGSLQELEETTYWLELLEEMEIFAAEKLKPIQAETKELTAIFVTIAKKLSPENNNPPLRTLSFRLYPLSFNLASGSAQGLSCELR